MTKLTQLERLGLFEAKVPRYTSYPIVSHFSEQVSNEIYKDWLLDIPGKSKISIYVHIPFCKRLCWFCACRTQGVQFITPVDNYLKNLAKELMVLHDLLPKGISLSHLHWGGGTPTLLPPDRITELSNAINSIVTVSPTTEFSVEIDPTEVDLDKIKALVKCGMTRASFGIQDFNPKIQTSIGRKQSFNETKFAIDQVRDHGIRSVNVDLVYGLPFQTQTGFDQTIRKIQELRPDRIALYGYAHVPWMAKRQRMIPESSLPTPHQRLALFESAKIVLLSAGYKQVGIDHFALPEDSMAIASDKGKMRRNFQGYTTDSSEYLIGIGASAISRFPEGYAQNYASTSAYAKVIQQGGLAIERGHKFDTYDKMIGQIIESLMCNFQADTKDIVSNHPISKGQLHSLFNHVNKQFKFSLKISNKGLSIPESLRPLTRVIARKFDNYELSHRGHSNAI